MFYRVTKKILMILMSAVIVLSEYSFPVRAGVFDNSKVYNEEILEELNDVIGNEAQARKYYSLLEEYGLIDENGNIVDDLSAEIDGVQYSSEELIELLSGDYDGNRIAIVDGMAITLDNLWNIIVIEGYINYLRENLNNDSVWTEEHEKTYESLLEQINNGGIAVTMDTDPSMEGDYSEINHGAEIYFTASREAGGEIVVTVHLTSAKAGQQVSFDCTTVSGSAKVNSSTKTVSLTADENGDGQEIFIVGYTPEEYNTLIADAPVWYINIDNLKNARIDTGAGNIDVVSKQFDAATLKITANSTIGTGKMLDRIVGTFTKKMYTSNGTVTFTSGEKYAINNGLVSSVEETEMTTMTTQELLVNEMQSGGQIILITLSDENNTELVNASFQYDTELVRAYSGSYEYRYNLTGINGNTEHSLEGITVENGFQYTYSGKYITPTFTFIDSTAPAINSIYVQSGEYTVGQSVPIIVDFSEPVSPTGAYMTVNGKQISAGEKQPSSRLSFLYPVQEVDSAHPVVTKVYVKDVAGNTFTSDRPDPLSEDGSLVLQNAVMNSCLPQSAITDFESEINCDDPLKPVLEVTVTLADDEELTAFIASSLDENGASSALKVAIGGFEPEKLVLQGETVAGGTMTASFELPLVAEETERTVELYINDILYFGFVDIVIQKPVRYIGAEDLSVFTLVRNSEGGNYEYEDVYNPVIYVQDSPIVTAFFELNESDFTFADINNTTTLDADGRPLDPKAHFAWSSSDTSIANIDKDGNITPTGKAGSVYFILTALNGGFEGKAVSVNSYPIRFGSGLTPFLLIPNKRISTSDDRDIPVFWSSNIIDKDETATFEIIITGSSNETVYSAQINGQCSAVIPASTLKYNYDNSSANTYNFTVSCSYQSVTYSDSGMIVLSAAPAVITIEPFESYYFTDSTDKIQLNWNIKNLTADSDRLGSLFQLYVTKNDQSVISYNNPGNGQNGVYNGSYNIKIDDVVTSSDDPASYRDVYTVSLQVKNGASDSYSYASCVFYVYDQDALKIWVEGKQNDGTVTLSNIDEISAMTQDQILALKRDISLQTVISANYGEYAWTDLSDRISWKISDSSVGSINYRQGSYYASIDNYAYTDYRPMTEFMLAGLSDGDATVTAQHVFSKISASTEVHVETLKDRLYLFAVTPAVRTTARYTNGNGEKKEVNSDEQGRFAVYEESGIKSDVWFTSYVDGQEYYGTYYQYNLHSGEQDPVSLNLYPCNNLVLRQAAYGYVYLKYPDGTPYNGLITFRGGVYVNGRYVEDGKFSFEKGQPAINKGDKDNYVYVGKDGKLTVVMDSTQWNQGSTDNYDDVKYVFVVSVADNREYYPLLVEIEAGINQDSYVRSGEAIARFRTNETVEKHPFIFDEKVEVICDEDDIYNTINILDSTGCLGVSTFVSREDIALSVMWWGTDKSQKHDYDMSLFTENRYEINQAEKTVTETSYPFVDAAVTTIKIPFVKDNAIQANINETPQKLQLRYEDKASGTVYNEELSFRIADTSDDLFDGDKINGIVDGINDSIDVSNSKDANGIDLGDRIMNWMLKKLADDDYSPDKEHASGFSLQIMATEDPTVYIGYIGLGLSNMTNTNVTGVYADGSNKSKGMYFPGFREMKWAFIPSYTTSNYWNQWGDDITSADNGEVMRKYHYTVTGYLESRIFINDYGTWDIKVLSGGFDAGGGVSLVRYFNTVVGYVPVTAELRGGGTLEYSLDVLTMEYLDQYGATVSDPEYLSKLRIFAYFKAFGGLGFDYSAIACKIGFYGQINFDFVAEWLNRPYMNGMVGNARYVDGTEIESSEEVLSGQQIKVNGQIGIEFYVKLWIFSYEVAFLSKDFKGGSWEYNDFNLIQRLWSKSQQYYDDQLHSLVAKGYAQYIDSDGMQLCMLNFAPTLETFDYLYSENERSWNKSTMKVNNSNSAEVMQSNANPFTNPVISDDGNIMLYLSDDNGQGDDAVHTAYAINNGTGYSDCGIICNEGAGDSSNVISGTKDFAVAAWSSLGEAMAKDAGSVLSDEDMMIMLEGSEIYASVYTDGKWSTVRLTENSSADISPVVAVKGNHAVVAWRSVATSRIGGNMSDFNVRDDILYKVYDGSNWSETMMLYNGSSGNIKALNIGMLDDGTAAVIYTLDTDRKDETATDREILWTVIDSDGQPRRTVQATTDGIADENPQITVTSINGQQCFVAGWYSYEAVNEEVEYDIHMADFTADGVIRGTLPQSVKKLVDEKGLLISSDFHFVRNAEDINDLALIWVERVEKETDSLTVESDILNSVKFFSYGNSNELLSITPVQTIAEAPYSTAIDSFDSYMNKGEVVSVFLGTTYDPNETMEKVGTTFDGTQIVYEVSARSSAIFTSRSKFEDSIELKEMIVDPQSLRLGAATTVACTIVNTGIHPVDSVVINIGGQITRKNNLNLLPGECLSIYADYQVPTDTVKDEEYIITASTSTGEITVNDTAYFGKTDLEIIKAVIIEENEGKRTIEFGLNNSSDSLLFNSGKTVEIEFFADSTLEKPITDLEKITVSDNDSLKMIDEGGFSRQIVFDVKQYLEKVNEEMTEIPETGIPVYIRATVVNNGKQCEEFNYENNSASVLCENLYVRTGTDTTIKSKLQADEEGTTVTVNIRNNHLTETSTGNVVVTLYDENNNIIAQKQCYDPDKENCGLVTIKGEETVTLTFSFEEKGVYAEVSYTDSVLDDSSDASLAVFDIINIPGTDIDDFTENDRKKGYYEAETEETDEEKASIVLSPTDPEATITLNGKVVDGYAELDLKPGKNRFDFVVTSRDGKTVRHYVITIVRSGGNPDTGDRQNQTLYMFITAVTALMLVSLRKKH